MRQRFNRGRKAAARRDESGCRICVLCCMLGFPALQACGAYSALDIPLPAAWRILGLCLAAASLALLWAGYRDLGRNWSDVPEVPRSLVTHGIYGRVRHPIYSAALLWCLGQSLALANWVSGMLLPALLVIVLLARTDQEERLLLARFGHQYWRYMQRVPRFLPAWPGNGSRG